MIILSYRKDERASIADKPTFLLFLASKCFEW
jgi:hypothetical protein